MRYGKSMVPVLVQVFGIEIPYLVGHEVRFQRVHNRMHPAGIPLLGLDQRVYPVFVSQVVIGWIVPVYPLIDHPPDMG